MTYTTRSMFTVPLTSKAYKLAKSFQSQYEHPAKARQVYLNTLAVYAVDTYCECLGIETDLEACESLNPVMQPLMNIADLEIEGIGKLECLSVLPEDEYCDIPPETWSNRIGYVAVEINDSSREATLLGFYPSASTSEIMERIYIEDFLSLEILVECLNRLESARDLLESNEEVAIKVRERLANQSPSEIAAQLERIYRTYNRYEWKYAGGEFLASYLPTEESVPFRSSTAVRGAQPNNLPDLAKELLEKLDEIWGDNNVISGIIKLSDWLENIDSLLESGFQSLETFLNTLPGNQVFRFATVPPSRSAGTEGTLITGVKEIQLAEHRLALVVSCELESKQTTDIILRLYPTGDNTYLPAGVQLIVLDESGDIFLEATARSVDNWLQLLFSGKDGQRFSVKLAFGDINVIYNFVI